MVALLYLIIGLTPVNAEPLPISGALNIPSIELSSEITNIEIENHTLPTPDFLVGAYSSSTNKTLLIGHATTVFQNLHKAKLRDEIYYNDKKYIITDIKIVKKEAIKMSQLLKPEEQDTLVVMTCAGTSLPPDDATHRLIITAMIE